MIHETLFFLLSKPELPDSEYNNLFELQGFLHPAEQNLLHKIVEIPKKYHKICDFIKIVENLAFKNDSEEETKYAGLSQGLYLKAFGCGLQKALEPYQQEIVDLEATFLEHPQLPLTYILCKVDKYEALFDDLHSMIDMIVDDNLFGCLLIGRLQKYLHSGNVLISNAANIIIKTINTTFFYQLSNWIIYGEVVDTYNEFFITDEKCPDPNFLYPKQDEYQITVLGSIRKMKVPKPPIVKKFSINWDMVPIFINEDMAESILFIGRLIWILGNDPERSTDEYGQSNSRKEFWEGRETEYSNKIENLQSDTFNDFEFTQIIEECRVKLTKFTLSLMLEEGNVKAHLQLIRDYYALGRGELFQQFMTAVEIRSEDSMFECDMVNLNFLFMDTAKRLYGDHDQSYQRFELVITEGDILTTNFWSRLELNFDIKWPLHIVFHPKAMGLYKRLFSYLLRFKKSQMNLNRLWQIHVSGKQKVDHRLWTLRHNLMFLINNLHYYLQVDVIEANFSVFEKALRNANELEDVIRIHHDFISSLLSKTFVLDADESYVYKNKHRLYQDPALETSIPSKMYRIIMALLELSDEFSLAARTWEEKLTEPEVLELEDFKNRADTIVETLLFTLFNLRKKERGDHLFQLLDQLNFNEYFLKNTPNLSLTEM